MYTPCEVSSIDIEGILHNCYVGFLFLVFLFNLITLPNCWVCMFRCSNEQHSVALGKCSHTQGKGYLLRDSVFERQSPDLKVWSEGYKDPEAEERTKAAGLTSAKGRKPDTRELQGPVLFSPCPYAKQETAKQGWKKPPSVVNSAWTIRRRQSYSSTLFY